MTRPSAQGTNHPKPRSASLLSQVLEKKLSNYAMAAGSAGVALLAFVQPAEAKIVFTKTDIAVPVNGGSVWFDINGDGQNDFALSVIHFGASTCTFTQGRRQHKRRLPLGCGAETNVLKVRPAQAANEVWQAGTSSTGAYPHKCAADVFAGRRIGPLRPFGAGTLVMAGYSGSSIGFAFCPWRGEHKPYLGVKFLDSSGNLHYGWVRVQVIGTSNTTIEGYAYETTPNTPIVAGQTSGADNNVHLQEPSTDSTAKLSEPANLGRLAQGAAGIVAWRRELDAEALQPNISL